MNLDRRMAHEIAQALLRARNTNDRVGILEGVAQPGTASGDGSYGEPVFEGTGFLPASCLDVTIADEDVNQSHRTNSAPRSYLLRDAVGSSYTSEAPGMVKARGTPVHELLAFKETPNTSSRPANPQTLCGRPLAANAVGTLQHKYLGYLWEDLFPSHCKTL